MKTKCDIFLEIFRFFPVWIFRMRKNRIAFKSLSTGSTVEILIFYLKRDWITGGLRSFSRSLQDSHLESWGCLNLMHMFKHVPSQVPDDSLVPHTGRHLI